MIELKKNDTKALIGLVSKEIDRVGEARRRYGFYAPSHFYQLIDIRNKLLTMPFGEEPSSSISGEVGREILRARG